jgi:hypothetical protein
MIHKTDSTQPSTPVQPKRRGRAFLINALILIVVLGVAVFAGYQSGIGVRKDYEASVILPQLAEQFVFAEEDIKAGRYENARERLEWIVAQDPTFPGVQEKLTEVLVQVNLQQGIQSPTPSAPTATATPDFSGVEQAFEIARQQINAQDWVSALGTLDQIRKLEPTYRASQVDGMYYFAFRNYGYDLIIKQGNLEGGIYQITLAERFGPLDRDTNGLREGARVYLIGASFWELDWSQAVFYFEQARNWGNLWDGTMTATERYWFAAMRYGDELFAKGEICGDGQALAQYTSAMTIAALDKVAQTNYNDAMLVCFPPTPTIDPNSLFTPTIDPSLITPIATTEVPTNTPELPTPTP